MVKAINGVMTETIAIREERDEWVIMQRKRDNDIPAVIPMNVRAAILHLPPTRDVTSATRSHITKNGILPRGERALFEKTKASSVEIYKPNMNPTAMPPIPPLSWNGLKILIFDLSLYDPGKEGAQSAGGGKVRVRSKVKNAPAKVTSKADKSKGIVYTRRNVLFPERSVVN